MPADSTKPTKEEAAAIAASKAAIPPPPVAVDVRVTADPNFRPGDALGSSDYMTRRNAMKRARAPIVEYRSEGVPTITKIPRGCRITVVMLPGRQEVISGLEVFNEFTPTLDPGRYGYTLIRDVDPPRCTTIQRWTGEFLAHLTDAQADRLAYLEPRMAKGMLTSDGARYICGFMGCGQRFTSKVQIIIHEGEHFGRDLLREPDDTFDLAAEEISAAGADHVKAKQAAKLRQATTPIQPEP